MSSYLLLLFVFFIKSPLPLSCNLTSHSKKSDQENKENGLSTTNFPYSNKIDRTTPTIKKSYYSYQDSSNSPAIGHIYP
jgi:hypothetical protein